jgi:N-methylhydantoinase A
MSSGYIVATDVGGTCTDTVIVSAGRPLLLGKALSTPPDFAFGVLDSVRTAIAQIDISLEQLLQRTSLFIHGSTVVDNTVISREGARTGLITTAGFEDTLFTTRGAYGRWAGLTEEGIKDPVNTDRAVPLIKRDCVVGLKERIDHKGEVLDRFDDEEAEAAVRHLLKHKGIEALAVCFLWSCANPVHERKMKALIERIAPDLFCTISSDIAPIPGEYERTSTAVINAYAGSVTRAYLQSLQDLLSGSGYRGPLMVMQGYGGLIPAQEAQARSIGMLECGPAAGVIGSRMLGETLGQKDIIAADMGGTTFKVSVIQNGEIEYAKEPIVDRFHYAQPKIEVVSIGAGGGSIVWLEDDGKTPRIGPRSAGSRPGPVCYGLGGEEPTLTDIFMLLGYMDPTRFLGGAVKLDYGQASTVFDRKIARPLGMSVEEAAIGVYRVATAQVADLIREVTVERGLDPRDFVLHAFGGSCGMVASLFGGELGVRKIVVPYTASVNCALGLVASDIVHQYFVSRVLPADTEPDVINNVFAPMEARGREQLRAEGFDDSRIAFNRSVDLRYARQVHQVTTQVQSPTPLDTAGLEKLVADFEALYERKFGLGSAYREAGIEMTQFTLRARGLMDKPHLEQQRFEGSKSGAAAKIGRRRIFVAAREAMYEADIYDFERLEAGSTVEGPCVIHTPITTIVLQQDQIGSLDSYRNVIVELVGEGARS